jgi:DNA uptake protein ComE-like DNA-binding protein
MADEVEVNAASPGALAALLGMGPAEAARLAGRRPFATEEAFREALPPRLRRLGLGLRLPKRNLNGADRTDLVERLGIGGELAEAVLANRPYYYLLELRAVPGMDPGSLGRIAEAFEVPALRYVDKLSGQDVCLAPILDEVVLRHEPDGQAGLESAFAAERIKLRKLGETQGEQVYARYGLPETETAAGVLTALKASGRVSALPGFRVGERERRYFDPEYVTVKFDPGTDPAARRRAIKEAGTEIAEEHREDGLYTLRLQRARTDPAATFEAIGRLNQAPGVRFAEPAYIGFDDFEAAPTVDEALPARAGEALPARAGEASPAASGEEAPDRAAGGGLPWNLAMIRAEDAWAAGTGDPRVVVAVIDSGVDEGHPALEGALLPREAGDDWNFDTEDAVPLDEKGHGTFVAGLVAGQDGTGLAPGCRILPLRIPLTGSAGGYARRRAAILYALDRVPAGHRLVMNLSWKTTGDVTAIRDAIETAAARGAVIVSSAGNWPERADQPHYPSDYRDVVSVGAVGPDGRRAPYSFHGAEVDVAAPGGSGSGDPAADVVSLALGGGTRTDFGTSFAAPHVAALAALLLSLDPSLTPAEVRAAIEGTASARPAEGLGAGLVDAAAAVARLRGEAPPVGPEPPQPKPPEPEPPESRPRQPEPREGGALDAINGLAPEGLAARYGMHMITARIVAAKRPWHRIEDVRGVLGMTDEAFARILADGDGDGGGAAAGCDGPEFADVNRSSLEELLRLRGMPRFTARVIVARRPHESLLSIGRIPGVTPALLDHLRAD